MTQPEWIAKDCLDVGLFTNRLDEQLVFWQQKVGLEFDHMLPVGGGVRQHRHDFERAVLKLNHTRDPLSEPRSGGYRRLIISKPEQANPVALTDPDGNRVQIVPRGHQGVQHWAIEVETRCAEDFFEHYEHRLGLVRSETHPIAVRCGRSLIIGVERSEDSAPSSDDPMQGLGFRYVTVQVRKVDSVHQRAVALGANEGAAPRTLGETARISFLKDPDGNWMELSQRASITGSLEPG